MRTYIEGFYRYHACNISRLSHALNVQNALKSENLVLLCLTLMSDIITVQNIKKFGSLEIKSSIFQNNDIKFEKSRPEHYLSSKNKNKIVLCFSR